MTKRIEIDDELYRYIASHTQHIGESASAILRRLLGLGVAEQATGQPVIAMPETTDAATSASTEGLGRRTIFDVMTRADLAGQRSIVARFLYILSMLYKCHNKKFDAVLQISGRDRQYFAKTEAELEASGTSTNPKQIPDAPYFVVTNNNTTRKKSMLTQVAIELGYSQEHAEKIRDFL
ncbi:replication initiation negative regulator SeqA [Pseudidiomarina andamanensis]|uniref:Negative modulator of initiation of replication n=1 Tax=Pseudidiomarina andamanensis TaxID=1940690 RepID=A0AA92ET12_9GAMM|nr:replication initiation negative regulator SeqA [Pseudidiomarina andamanensis]MDS0218532.1 replication initiation negative regulator SeqA [Pseudidiomarina andamanensis]QGT95403.1 replication initiation negative regulator SeqA [Pseudidiomarina andamanensis]